MFSSVANLSAACRLRHLLGGLIDLGFLGCDLGFDVFCRRFVLTDLRVGLIDRGFVVSRVDGREQIAFFHDLVVGDIDADNAAGDLRADQHRPAIDKGIVRTLVVTGVKIPRDARNDADDDQSKADDHRDRVLSECALDALGTLLPSLIGFRRLAVGFSDPLDLLEVSRT